jgi:sterol desaturase/sphingolipid hydroxylase (fatty acid hydroxylase superfamily)
MPSWFLEALERAFFPFVVSSDRFYWPNIVAYFVIALAIFAWNRKAITGFFNFILPKEIYNFDSRSFFLSDLIFFVFTGFVLAIIAGLKSLDQQQEIISFLLPYFPTITQPRTDLFFIHALALHVAVDFGWYVGHYMFHKNEFFWEFHKVHHAPTALTPLTNKRFHLVEHTLLSLSIFISTITVDLIVTCLLVGSAGDSIYLAKVAASFAGIVFVVNIPGHLRHSHVWLSYGRIGNELFLSPAMHQIHHSEELIHRDKNFGRDYSFFDRLFGTIYVPAYHENFKLGIGHESRDYISFWDCWYLPFVRSWNLFMKRKSEDLSKNPRISD